MDISALFSNYMDAEVSVTEAAEASAVLVIP